LNQQLSSLGPSNRNPPQPTTKPFSPGHRSRQLNPAIRNSRIACQIRSPGAPKAQGKARSVASDETRPLSTSPLARLDCSSNPHPRSLASSPPLSRVPQISLLAPGSVPTSCFYARRAFPAAAIRKPSSLIVTLKRPVNHLFIILPCLPPLQKPQISVRHPSSSKTSTSTAHLTTPPPVVIQQTHTERSPKPSLSSPEYHFDLHPDLERSAISF
jgi:hypothetical protein